MKKRILAYTQKVDRILEENKSDTDWKQVLEEHLTQIAFFQHERLIHLIVTVTFAVLTLMTILAIVWNFSIGLFMLAILLLILLVPYVMHYYLLENQVQKMYEQYDAIWKQCNL